MTNPFVTGEGDAWYKRNRDALAKYDITTDPVAMLCDPAPGWKHTSKPVPSTLPSFNRIVDIGCSSGERLIAMCNRIGAYGVGIDLSHEAIARAKFRTHNFPAGTRKFGWIEGGFKHLAYLPSMNFGGTLDWTTLYMTIFVWHWLPREELMESMALITDMTKNGDCLCIGDFAPDARQRRKYHHLPDDDVWTWKADYQWMFQCTGPWKQISSRNVHVLLPGIAGGKATVDELTSDEYCELLNSKKAFIDHTRNYTLLRRVDWKDAYQEEVATPPSPPQSSP